MGNIRNTNADFWFEKVSTSQATTETGVLGGLSESGTLCTALVVLAVILVLVLFALIYKSKVTDFVGKLAKGMLSFALKFAFSVCMTVFCLILANGFSDMCLGLGSRIVGLF